MFKEKIVGIDLFDQPVKAVNLKKGIFLDREIKEFFRELPFKGSIEMALELIERDHYWGNFEILQTLLSGVVKSSGAMLIKPGAVLSFPYEMRNSQWGNLFESALQAATLQGGFREVHLIENYMLAALGCGVPIDGYNSSGEITKNVFLYGNKRCTYLTLLFAGKTLMTKVLEEGYNTLQKDSLEDEIYDFISKIPKELPDDIELKRGESRKKLQSDWDNSINNTVYFVVPEDVRHRFGISIGKYHIEYGQNYDNCIINVLEKAIDRLKNGR